MNFTTLRAKSFLNCTKVLRFPCFGKPQVVSWGNVYPGLKTPTAPFGVFFLVSLLVPSAVRSEDTFFPIGIWEAQRIPIYSECGNPDATTLDEIREGTFQDTISYVSGINAVFCYFHADLNADTTTADQVQCYLEEAEDLGFKAIIKLSETVDFIACTLYERTPPITALHTPIIERVVNPNTPGHEALLGFILDDEPAHAGTGPTSAESLVVARAKYLAIDNLYGTENVPYFMPQFDSQDSANGVPGWKDFLNVNDRRCDWFWDGNHPEIAYNNDHPFTHSCGVHGPSVIKPDYRYAADVTMFDNYYTVNADWRLDLGQFDDLVGGPSEVQVVLANEYTNPTDINPTEWEPEILLTAAQLRTQAYGYIVHGAEGVWFFSYTRMYNPARINDMNRNPDYYDWGTFWAPEGDILYTQAPDDFVTKIVPLSNELANILPFLEGETAGTYWRDDTPCGGEEHSFGAELDLTASAGDIHYMLKYAADDPTTTGMAPENLLIAVNASDEAASVSFGGLNQLSSQDTLVAPARGARVARRINEPDSLVIAIVGGGFSDQFDPWGVHVYRFKAAETRLATQQVDGIENAIDQSDVGDIVEVDVADESYSALTLKNHVLIVARNGTPTISAGSNTSAVRFPADASAATILDGFNIEDGDTTVVLRGAGVVRNCSIDSDDFSTIHAIHHTGGEAKIESTQVVLDLPSGDPLAAIKLLDSKAHIVYSSVTMNGGGSTTYAIEMAANQGPLACEVDYCFVTCPDGKGIFAAGTSSVHHCTVNDVYGIGIIDMYGSVVINNCIVADVEVGGPGIAGVASKVSYCISTTGFALTGGSGTGNSTEDPLFCDASNGEYTLRGDSYGSRYNNDSAERIGAFMVSCLYGTLVRNATIPTNAIAKMPLDTIVLPGDTLTVLGNSTINVDPDKQLIIRGHMETSGSTFQSAAGSPQEGDWDGIFVDNGSVDLGGLTVRHADYGVDADTLIGDSEITNCTFSDNASRDIRIGRVTGANSLLIESNTIEIGGETGIELADTCSSATIRDNELNGTGGTGGSVNGILLKNNSGSPTIDSNIIDGLGGGSAIKLDGGSATIIGNTLSNCKYGIWAVKSASADGGDMTALVGASGDSLSDNLIFNNTNGIRTEGAKVKIFVRENKIYSNNPTGVLARTSSQPDLGNGSQDGNNSIYSNTTYCVSNTTVGLGINAMGNWWNGGVAPTCTNGTVNTTDYLEIQPASSGEVGFVRVKPASTLRMLGVHPNPTTGRTVLRFELADGYGDVEVGIFDVVGRMVWRTERNRFGSGDHEIVWTGDSSRGTSVPNGIYFVRIAANQHLVATTRVILSR